MDDLSEAEDRVIKPVVEAMDEDEDAALRDLGDGTIDEVMHRIRDKMLGFSTLGALVQRIRRYRN
ncbi:hypothetical protein [Microvirga arsenatis]|uniref:hypothetical protein n=1 Tax=Microvirga arsenatis TaxID=2692265 RepID=UPI003CCE56C5